ncbi:GxxExxY protein [candidate division WOR-3 bacterium]|nr:GxxExxY protein [candidate division WOR-3 bacterium]
MNANRHRLNKISEKIIGCAFQAHNTLGCGFLEKVYENALVIELRKVGLKIIQQAPIKVYYKSETVGDYIADILAKDKIIVEIKAVKYIDEIHEAQLINYLKATRLKLGLILNFSRPKLEIKRLVNEF